MGRIRRWAWVVFVVFALLGFLFGVFPGVWFEEDPVEREMQWLVTSYAAVAVALTLALVPTAFRRGERWAGLARVLDLAAFFVIHGAVFFVVDFAFAAAGIVALVASAPRTDSRPTS